MPVATQVASLGFKIVNAVQLLTSTFTLVSNYQATGAIGGWDALDVGLSALPYAGPASSALFKSWFSNAAHGATEALLASEAVKGVYRTLKVIITYSALVEASAQKLLAIAKSAGVTIEYSLDSAQTLGFRGAYLRTAGEKGKIILSAEYSSATIIEEVVHYLQCERAGIVGAGSRALSRAERRWLELDATKIMREYGVDKKIRGVYEWWEHRQFMSEAF